MINQNSKCEKGAYFKGIFLFKATQNSQSQLSLGGNTSQKKLLLVDFVKTTSLNFGLFDYF